MVQHQDSPFNHQNACANAHTLLEDTSWLQGLSGLANTSVKNLSDSLYETYSSIEHSYYYISAIFGLAEKFDELKEAMQAIENKPTVLNHLIYGLSSPSYHLKHPLNIILEIYTDEVIATLPDLEIFGEGDNQFEAIKDLKHEIIDLFIDLNEIADESLDDQPLSWKQIINDLVEKV